MKFAGTHEWIEVDQEVGTVGVSEHAQEELGDIVYVELPELGREVKAGEEAAVLESTKAAADIYTPVSGVIVEVNEKLNDVSELVNESPEQAGWLFRVRLTQPEEMNVLMSPEEYQKVMRE